MTDGPEGANPLAQWPRPLCFVFSGGASYGASQVGMVRALTEFDVIPDMVVGASVGALNGVVFANDPQSSAARLDEIWRSMSRSGVFGTGRRMNSMLTAARNGLRKNSVALYSPDPLGQIIKQHTPVARLEDLPIPVGVVTTDALAGRTKVLSQGPAAEALLASTAVPGLFPPVKIGGSFYIDGGMSANVPIRPAIAFGARSIVVLNATPASMPGTLPTSVIDSVVHASQIMQRNQGADTTDELAGTFPILHLPQVTPPTHNPFDFDHSAELLGVSYLGTKEFLAQLPDLADSSRALSQRPDGDYR